MDKRFFDVEGSPLGDDLETAHKSFMAAAAGAATYAGVLLADVAEAGDWVFQTIAVAGAALSTALVYFKKNYPRR